MNTHDLRFLVTGASGFIGSRLALHLSRMGIDAVFTGLDANDAERARVKELAAAGVTVRLGDLREASFVRDIVAGRNAVLHLAAAQHEHHMSDEHFHSVNVDATRLLLRACAQSGVRRFVYGSTMGIFGSARHGPIHEESAPNPLNVYTRTKLLAEVAVRELTAHMETVICRISETYGPGDLRLLKLFRAIDRGRFVMIGAGDNQRQPIYVDDLIRVHHDEGKAVARLRADRNVHRRRPPYVSLVSCARISGGRRGQLGSWPAGGWPEGWPEGWPGMPSICCRLTIDP